MRTIQGKLSIAYRDRGHGGGNKTVGEYEVVDEGGQVIVEDVGKEDALKFVKGWNCHDELARIAETLVGVWELRAKGALTIPVRDIALLVGMSTACLDYLKEENNSLQERTQ